MALISKIRRNFWIVLILLGLALASFVIMDVLGSRSNSGLFNQTTVGKVGNEKIDYFEFQNVERALYSGGQDVYQSRAGLWDYLVSNKISEKMAEKLGLGVGKDELMDLQFGNNLSPVIQNSFRDPNTGQVDFNRLMEIKTALDAGQELPQDFRFQWSEQEKQIKSVRIQDKISTMVSKAMYTPSWLADLTGNFQSESADGIILKVPFDYIADADVKLTDADYSAFIEKNKGKLMNEQETRLIDYIALDVLPTVGDSAAIYSKMQQLATDFATTTNDSSFAANNNGILSPIYNKIEDFSGEIKNKVGSLAVGQVTDPFMESGAYVVAKLVDKKVLPDSVQARHILKSTVGGASIAKARASIDSIRGLLVSGAQSFDSLARKASEDPGSAQTGGDLGTFAQGRMVKPFNDACFINSTEGSYYTVETQFGIHLIQVQKKIFNDNAPKYKVALVSEAIIPSEETQNKAYDRINDLLAKNRTIDALKKAADKEGLTVETSRPMLENDFQFQNLGGGQTSRDIIKWAFEAAPGDVSPTIHNYNDQVNYYTKSYVLAALNKIDKPGLLSVAAAKSSYEIAVRNMKKAEIIKTKMTGSEIYAVASQLQLDVDSVSNANYLNGSAELAGEPKVIATLFGLKQGATSKAFEGISGVFMVKNTNKTAGLANNNLPAMKQTTTSSVRASVPYRLWPSIKKSYKIEDNRARFY